MAGTGLIQAYLEQLRTQLPRTPDTDDVIAEVEDHLHTIVEAHLTLGLSEEAATRHAVGAFGSAELVARAFAQQRGDHTAMPTTFTTSAGAAAIVGGVTLAICLSLASFTTLDVGSNSAWFAPTASAGGLLALVGLIGLHARHRARYGMTGRVARLLIPVATLVLVGSVFTWFAPGYFVSMAALAIGLVGLGVEVWRGGVVDRGAIVLCGVAIAGILPIATLQNDAATTWSPAAIGGSLVAIVLGAGLVWLGHGLWRERSQIGVGGSGRPTATA